MQMPENPEREKKANEKGSCFRKKKLRLTIGTKHIFICVKQQKIGEQVLLVSLDVPAYKHGGTTTKDINTSTLFFNQRSALSCYLRMTNYSHNKNF